jgi:hypothetical protein
MEWAKTKVTNLCRHENEEEECSLLLCYNFNEIYGYAYQTFLS